MGQFQYKNVKFVFTLKQIFLSFPAKIAVGPCFHHLRSFSWLLQQPLCFLIASILHLVVLKWLASCLVSYIAFDNCVQISDISIKTLIKMNIMQVDSGHLQSPGKVEEVRTLPSWWENIFARLGEGANKIKHVTFNF